MGALRQSYQSQTPLIHLFRDVQENPAAHPHHKVKDGMIFYKGRALIPAETVLQPLLLAKFHSTPIGSHAGIQRTYAHLVSAFYWPLMHKMVRDYVNHYSTCQSTKTINTSSQGLIQPLPILGKI